MDKAIEFEQVVERVKAINAKLRDREFTPNEIDKFWSKLIHLTPKIKEHKGDIKICTGCGKLNIEEMDKKYLACCPDNHYIKVTSNKN